MKRSGLIPILGFGKYFSVLSFLLMLLVPVLFYFKGLNLGVDFSGGIVFEIQSDGLDISKLRSIMEGDKNNSYEIQEIESESSFLIRFKGEERDLKNTREFIERKLPKCNFRKMEYVGAKMGSDLVKQGIIAMILAIIGILVYTTFRFDKIYGVVATVAIIHDIALCFGLYVISQIEFDLKAVAVLLTIIGYSVNDTIVIFDRVRENLAKYKVKDFGLVVNRSLNETLRRTLITSLTTLSVCIALLIFGGKGLYTLSVGISFGIIVGTYSSIFLASPLLVKLRRV